MRPPLRTLLSRGEDYAGIEGGMRVNQDTEPHGESHVAVLEGFLDQMGTMSEEYLRLALYFRLAEHRAGRTGVSVPLTELARGTGMSAERVQAALESLVPSRRVEADGPRAWRWRPYAPRGE